MAGDEDTCEAVGESLVHGPRLLLVACVCISSFPTTCPNIEVRTRCVIYVAVLYRPIEAGFALPGTGRLAAVPKSRCDGLASNVQLRPNEEHEKIEGEESMAKIGKRHGVIGVGCKQCKVWRAQFISKGVRGAKNLFEPR